MMAEASVLEICGGLVERRGDVCALPLSIVVMRPQQEPVTHLGNQLQQANRILLVIQDAYGQTEVPAFSAVDRVTQIGNKVATQEPGARHPEKLLGHQATEERSRVPSIAVVSAAPRRSSMNV
jgi:hypothetical protein